jgi:hypothetical protein
MEPSQDIPGVLASASLRAFSQHSLMLLGEGHGKVHFRTSNAAYGDRHLFVPERSTKEAADEGSD